MFSILSPGHRLCEEPAPIENGYRIGDNISSGKAETSLTSVTRDTSFEDHMSEFVRRTENGAKKDQHVKVRLSSQY